MNVPSFESQKKKTPKVLPLMDPDAKVENVLVDDQMLKSSLESQV